MIALHRCGTGVVSGQSKQDLIGRRLKAGKEVAEKADAAIGILHGIVGVDAELAGGVWHQLHEPNGTFGRQCVGAHGRFGFHHTGDKFRGESVFEGSP